MVIQKYKILSLVVAVTFVLTLLPQGTAYAATLINESIFSASDKAANAHFGADAAISGDYAMIAAHNKAYIYHWNGTSWEEQQILTASDGGGAYSYDCSVSISGDYAIMGFAEADVSGLTDAGKAYIFHRSGTSWEEQQILTASDGSTNDFFGWSVSISGDDAIVGAERAASDGLLEAGKAYVYHRNGTSWEEQQILTASDGDSYNWFGHSISISGDRVMIGAPYCELPGIVESGVHVEGVSYIYHWNGTSWEEAQILEASDGAEADRFGIDVSFSGDYALVGAYTADPDGIADSGEAYLYHWNGTSWEEQQTLTASDAAEGATFGYSVSISGDCAIVGAGEAGVNGIYMAGKAYLFHRNGTNWTQQQILTASDATEGAAFGHSVVISGYRNIVGAAFANVSGIISAGEVYAYDMNYNVTYDANGGSGVPTDSTAYTSGSSVNVLFTTTPVRPGYAFEGWATASSAVTAEYTSGGAASFTIGASDVALYAVWDPTEFNVLGSTKHPNLRITDAAISGTTYHLIRGLNPLGETIDTVMDYFEVVNGTWTVNSWDAYAGTYTTVSDTSTDVLGNLFRIDVYDLNSILFGTYYITILGDLNCDGVINNTDSVVLANHTANVSAISGTLLLYLTDTDGNGICSNTDTAAVRNQANGKAEIEQ